MDLRSKSDVGIHNVEQAPTGRTGAFVNVKSTRFNLAIAFAIVLNAVVIGLETNYGERHFVAWENAFTCIFITEMVLKIEQFTFRGYLESKRNLFDAILVFVSVLDLWIIPLLPIQRVSGLQTFKLLRIFRIVRVVRLFSIFRELALILDAFIKAFNTVFWVFVLVLVLDYVCAIFLTQMLGKNAGLWGDKEEKINTWFGNIGNSMRTLCIIMTLSDWDDIVLTISERYNPFLVFVVAMAYILLTAYTMLSLITGCISEALITAQRMDEMNRVETLEKQSAERAEQVRDLLRMIDTDHSGCVTCQEVKEALASGKIGSRLAALGISMDLHDLLETIERLTASNADAEGEVAIEEIVDAISSTGGPAKSHTIWELKHQILKKEQEANARFDSIQEEVAELALGVMNLDDKLDLLMGALSRPHGDEPKGSACGPFGQNAAHQPKPSGKPPRCWQSRSATHAA